jgi:hypothetical protein
MGSSFALLLLQSPDGVCQPDTFIPWMLDGPRFLPYLEIRMNDHPYNVVTIHTSRTRVDDCLTQQ